MRNLLLLIIIGFASYGAHTVWNERYGDIHTAPSHVSEQQRKAAIASPNAEPNEVIKNIVSFTHRNLELILAPIQTVDTQPSFGQLTELKVALIAEMRKPRTNHPQAKLQQALQLTSVLEQAINHRAERVRQLYYNEGVTGAFTDKTKDFRLTNDEERKRFQVFEWRKRGTEQHWSDAAQQYRTTIERVLILLAS